MFVKLHPERQRHGIGGDVVMGRANAPGGDHIVVARPQRVQRINDFLHDIWNSPRLGQVHTDHPEVAGDIAGVGVLCTPGQDLVPDHQYGRCNGLIARLTHSGSSMQGPVVTAGPRLTNRSHQNPCARFRFRKVSVRGAIIPQGHLSRRCWLTALPACPPPPGSLTPAARCASPRPRRIRRVRDWGFSRSA